VQNGGMNTPQKQWPDNIKQFRIAGLAMSVFDQKIMVSLRRLADRTGETVEEHIHRTIVQFVKRCEAERELPTKVIPFPKLTRVQEVSPRKYQGSVEFPLIQRTASIPLPRNGRKSARSGALACCAKLTTSG
jgi:hypothetical protein